MNDAGGPHIDPVARFLGELERAGIPHCHWKGEAALAAGLRGERDLDFLVPAASFAAAEAALGAAGFVAARSRFTNDAPGTAHFFGYRPGLERLLHVHLHDRVLTGEDLITSHTLPFEADLLASPAFASGVRVPTPALEAALTVTKHAIRWGSWPDRLLARLRPKHEAEALRALLDDATVGAAAELVAERCPGFSAETFRACARLLREAGRGDERRRMARVVRQALAPFRTPNGEARRQSYTRALLARVRRLLDGDRRDKALRTAGVRIALVGGDPALAEELARWLGQAFAVRVARAPSGPPSLAPGEIVLIAGEPTGWTAERSIAIPAAGDREALRQRVWEGL